jgi:hypothetical protein
VWLVQGEVREPVLKVRVPPGTAAGTRVNGDRFLFEVFEGQRLVYGTPYFTNFGSSFMLIGIKD